jgi:23S rRNA pseudouridine2604 synthase
MYTPENSTAPLVRLNKHLADLGLCSRREGDALIAAGKVLVNGHTAATGTKVDPSTDEVTLADHYKPKKLVYYAYNKPVGIVSVNPIPGQTDILHHTLFPERVFPVGRLDKDSHGLILVTNDGRITKRLLEPQYENEKEYEVEVHKAVTNEFITHMAAGVTLEDDGYTTKPAKCWKVGTKKFRIVLTEGKKRQIRRMCETLEYGVTDLVRLRIGHIVLGTTPVGRYRPLDAKEHLGLMRKLELE